MSPVTHTPYVNVASVVKTQGLKGQVVVNSITGCPFCVPVGAQVFFTPPSLRSERSARIAQVDGSGQSALVVFEDIDDIGAAEQLVGKTILVRRTDVAMRDTILEEILGREVVCVDRGVIGTVVDVLDTPANRIWVVQGGYGEVLVPVIEGVVLDIPSDGALPLSIELLDGLIDEEAIWIRQEDSSHCVQRSGTEDTESRDTQRYHHEEES
jgi:16S rRNA processing protein RimM